jgi:glutamine amidotransferase
MRHGTVNADGFGAGWYTPDLRPEPARYRRAVPIWTDASFASFAPVVVSGCVLAAVRSATPGMPVEETATAPFTDGLRLLSHNGSVDPATVLRLLLSAGSPGARAPDSPQAPPAPDSWCDSALLAALVWERVAAGTGLAEAVATAVTAVTTVNPVTPVTTVTRVTTVTPVTTVAGAAPGRAGGAGETGLPARVNLLATDGTQVVATTWNDSLSYRVEDGGVLVVSEPDDDEPGWVDVPNHRILVADINGVTVSSLF